MNPKPRIEDYDPNKYPSVEVALYAWVTDNLKWDAAYRHRQMWKTIGMMMAMIVVAAMASGILIYALR